MNIHAPGSDGDGVCERCGGTHTRRQRCPADAELTRPAIAEPPPAAAAVPQWQPVYLPPSRPKTPATSVVIVRPRRPTRRYHVAATVEFAFPRHPRVSTAWWRSTLHWLGAIAGSTALIVSTTVASTYVVLLTRVDQQPQTALVVIAVSVAVASLAMALLFVSMRTYAKIVFAIMSLFLVTSGFMLLVIAPVLRQMNTDELAEYRAFAAFLWFGSVSVAAGLALGAACVRWAAHPSALRQLSRWSRLLGSGYGVVQGLSGVAAILTLLTLINASTGPLDDSGIVERAISITALGMWALVPGLLLTYQGISSSMGEGSGEFRLPSATYALAAWLAVLLLGWWIMATNAPLAAPMPLLHVLAAGMPGIALVALAVRGGFRRGVPVRWLTWRQVTLAAAISMTVGVQIALYVESIGSLGAVLLFLVHNGAFAGALNYADVQETISQSRFILTRNEQFAANLVTAALLAPLVEEFAKGLGVRIMMRRDTTRAQAFLLGAAAGAGFGFLEALLYGLAGIGHHHLDRWPLVMMIRGGSTSLHVFNTALVGLAWWYWSIGQRARIGWALFATAVLLHALWNGFAVTLDSRILGIDTLSDQIVEWIAYGVAGGIAIVLVAALPVISRRLREDAPALAGTPLAAMAPWMG